MSYLQLLSNLVMRMWWCYYSDSQHAEDTQPLYRPFDHMKDHSKIPHLGDKPFSPTKYTE